MGPEPTYTIHVCPGDCGSYRWCADCGDEDGVPYCALCDGAPLYVPVEVVPASVLEERDRELEVERRRSNGVAGHAGHWAKRARESALEAEQLRSQLDEWQERCRKLCDPEYGRWQETLLEAREALVAQREAA